MNNKISDFQDVFNIISKLKEEKEFLLIAIDGPSGSGKTTFANHLMSSFDADVVHMDDYFLPPFLRTLERYNTAGGNVHHERFLKEVLIPLSERSPYIYRPFDCKTMDYKDGVTVVPKNITVIEGSYSCHPQLSSFYDLKIYIEIDPFLQYERILFRNGKNKAQEFKDKWIPLENKYFNEFGIKGKSNIIIEAKEFLYE